MAFLYSVPPPLELSWMFSLFFVLEEMWEIDPLQWHPENQNRIKILERCPQSYANNFDLCKSLVPLTQKHNKFGSHCRSLKSQLGFVAENRRYAGKDSDGFSGYGKSSVCLQDNKTLGGSNTMVVWNPVALYHRSVAVRNLAQESSHVHAVNVGKRSPGRPSSLDIRELKGERSPTDATHVEKHSSRFSSLNIRELIREGSPMNLMNGKAFSRRLQLMGLQRSHTGEKPCRMWWVWKSLQPEVTGSRDISVLTPERNCMAAVCVGRPFPKRLTSLPIRDATQERSLMSAANAEEPSFLSLTWPSIREFTGKRNCVSAVTAKRPSEARQSSFSTSGLTPERPYSCSECGEALADVFSSNIRRLTGERKL